MKTQFSVPRGSLGSCTAHFIIIILITTSQEQLHYLYKKRNQVQHRKKLVYTF